MPVSLNIDANNMYLITAKETICIKDQESDFALVIYLFRKLTRRTAAFEMVKWGDNHENGRRGPGDGDNEQQG
ncbi:unnamed protein product [Porites lobata]|uniref:Uncharacterized protein n=1 Tax=Porites lobata TaxID=104759 RepID=A0ABN8P9X4_9CNID|nr:unnamed protein product [Porites lobata]CAH3112547.1 unnamed protein product [Porites lobata]CAH3139323.1 unnamed protein product [Porites lobata]